MNLFQACKNLNVWNTAKVNAELWQMSENYNFESLLELKIKVKSKYKELVRVHHPDMNGDSEMYLEIQRSNDMIKTATMLDFVTALGDEKQANMIYFEPGSKECNNCIYWSSIVNSCVTVICSGFKEHR